MAVCLSLALSRPLVPCKRLQTTQQSQGRPMAGARRLVVAQAGDQAEQFSSDGPLQSSSFTAADAAFLRAMAMRPRLPEHNIYWDDAVGDHNLIDGWHAESWQMWGQAADEEAATQQAPAED